ncbi:putative membrane protein [Marmoricola sp. OAE513]|uniref:hypothetical protein n=1 Tax=Marmoricola sp. OAE513 TaxID=2817894 RepID=UPI001AE7349D
MVSSLIGFWVAVRAFASGEDARVQNVALLTTAAVVVLLVVGLWSRSARAPALGVAAGLAIGLASAALLAVGFGAL